MSDTPYYSVLYSRRCISGVISKVKNLWLRLMIHNLAQDLSWETLKGAGRGGPLMRVPSLGQGKSW